MSWRLKCVKQNCCWYVLVFETPSRGSYGFKKLFEYSLQTLRTPINCSPINFKLLIKPTEFHSRTLGYYVSVWSLPHKTVDIPDFFGRHIPVKSARLFPRDHLNKFSTMGFITVTWRIRGIFEISFTLYGRFYCI